MDIWKQINQQRVKHIISSYKLDGGALEDASSPFNFYLEELFKSHPLPLIELALTETLVEQWMSMPMERGVAFLQRSHTKLKAWEAQPIVSKLTPAQFQQITGLNPAPIFGTSEAPPSRPILRPS